MLFYILQVKLTRVKNKIKNSNHFHVKLGITWKHILSTYMIKFHKEKNEQIRNDL